MDVRPQRMVRGGLAWPGLSVGVGVQLGYPSSVLAVRPQSPITDQFVRTAATGAWPVEVGVQLGYPSTELEGGRLAGRQLGNKAWAAGR